MPLYLYKRKMKITAFKAGKYSKEYNYKSFVPNFINKEWEINVPEINQLLESQFAFGRVKCLCHYFARC